jgi:tripartite ATP-independent transporter DctP family solute receptor
VVHISIRRPWYLGTATLVALVATALAAVACGGTASSGASPSVVPSFTLVFAGYTAPTDPITLAQNRFKAQVEHDSGGRIKVDVRPNSQMGAVTDAMELLRQGSLQMTITVGAYATSYVPDFQVVGLPFAFQSEQDALAKLNGQLGQELSNLLDAKIGVQFVGAENIGFVALLNRQHPVQTMADLKNMKVRTIPSPIYQKTWQLLGARPVGLDRTEVFTGLQQGTIDADTAPLGPELAESIYTVAPYITTGMNMVYNADLVFVNSKFLNGLPSDLRDIVLKDVKSMTDWASAQTIAGDGTALNTMKSKGGKVVALAASERATWKTTVQPVIDDFRKKFPAVTLLATS